MGAFDVWDALAAKYAGTDNWKAACVNELNQGVQNNESQSVFGGLVNRTGGFVDIGNDNNNVWGINLKVCYKYCGWDKLQTVGFCPRFVIQGRGLMTVSGLQLPNILGWCNKLPASLARPYRTAPVRDRGA